jgi:HEAT repeat protein
MDAPLAVFVSSAIGEFLAERSALKAAIERLPFLTAWVFEKEDAYSEPLVPGYLARVKTSDIVVLLLGEHQSQPVERELVAALEADRPILAFVKRSAQADADRLLARLNVADRFKYTTFDASELEGKVTNAIIAELVRRFRGVYTSELSDTELSELRRSYLREVVERYQFWELGYARTAATLRTPEAPSRLRGLAPPEFVPCEFERLERAGGFRTEDVGDLRDTIHEHEHVLLLGEPGAGKSTALWRLMYDHAAKGLEDPRAALPLFVSLPRYQTQKSFIDLLRAELMVTAVADGSSNRYPAHAHLARHLETWLNYSETIVLCDGLNEVPAAVRGEAIERLSHFREQYRRCRSIVTCREAEYTAGLRATEIRIKPLDRVRQSEFLTNYLGDEGDSLLKELEQRRPELLELGRNPYILRMIAEIHHRQGGIPADRNLIFAHFVDVLLERERRVGGRPSSVEPKIVVDVLADVALGMHEEHGGGTWMPVEWARNRLNARLSFLGCVAEYPVSRVLALAQSATLLEQSGDGSIRFTQELLRDYFAALGMKTMPDGEALLRKAARYPQWDEVLVLLAGLLGDASSLIELVMPVDPALAARCFRTAQPSPPLSLAERLIAALTKEIENALPGEPWRVARALADLATLDTLPLLIPVMSHEHVPVANAAISAINSLGIAALPSILPLVDDENRNTRIAARAIVIRVGTDAEIPIMVRTIIEDAEDILCESAVQALWRFPSEAVEPHITQLLRSRNAKRRMSALRVVREFKDSAAVPLILPLLSDSDPQVRRMAIDSAGSADAQAAIPVLMRLIEDDDSKTRGAAAESLGRLGHEPAVPKILPLLGDETTVRAAAEALRCLGPAAVLPQLASYRSQTHKEKSIAAEALGILGTESCITDLRTLIADDDPAVRRRAILALARVQPPPVEDLLAILNDSKNKHDSLIRESVARALSEAAPEKAMPVYIGLLKSHDYMQRFRVVEALSKMPSDRVLPYLLPLLTDDEQWIRIMTAETIGALKARAAIPHLLPILDMPDPVERRGAAFALGAMGVEQSIPHLLPLLKDPHGGARMGAAENLAAMTADVIPEIVPLLADPYAQIVQVASRILVKSAREEDLPLIARLLTDESSLTRDTAARVIAAVRRRLNLPKDQQIPSDSGRTSAQ